MARLHFVLRLILFFYSFDCYAVTLSAGSHYDYYDTSVGQDLVWADGYEKPNSNILGNSLCTVSGTLTVYSGSGETIATETHEKFNLDYLNAFSMSKWGGDGIHAFAKLTSRCPAGTTTDLKIWLGAGPYRNKIGDIPVHSSKDVTVSADVQESVELPVDGKHMNIVTGDLNKVVFNDGNDEVILKNKEGDTLTAFYDKLKGDIYIKPTGEPTVGTYHAVATVSIVLP